jgi:hypothetical protein
VCSICNEPSLDICVYCTKDTCRNHRCERCKRCSDCCECEVPLVEPSPELVVQDPAVQEPLSEEPLVEEHAVTAEPVEEPILPAPPQASEEPDLNIPAVPPMEPEPHK